MTAVVFDLGGVLIDWDPKHLYRKLFPGNEAAMERFLAEVCTSEWNEQHDSGRPFAIGVAKLQAQWPEYADLIAAYDYRWEEMLGEAITGTVAILSDLKETKIPIYALTNWSAEKFPTAYQRYDFLGWFNEIVISGEVGFIKPDPRFFRYFIDTYRLTPNTTIFIDDKPRNVLAAKTYGFISLQFSSAKILRADLEALHVLPKPTNIATVL